MGLCLISACSDPSSQQKDSAFVPRNVWAWRNSVDILNDPAAKSAFYQFATSHAVLTVYVNVRSMLENYGTPSALTTTEASLRTFLDEAAARSIRVHLLVGNSGSYVSDSEALSNAYPSMSLIATNAKTYVASLTGAKPEAIHWDVEPQQLADFSANKQFYVQRLVNAFQKTRAILSGTGILQAADIPHWWDNSAIYGATTCDPSNNLLTPAFTSQVGVYCLIRVLDQIDIMDYRDSAALSINQADAELSFAMGVTNFSGRAPRIVIGQEVANNSDLTLTFFDEIQNSVLGTRTLEVALQTLQNQYNSNPAFGGVGNQRSYDSTNPSLSRYQSSTSAAGAGISIEEYESLISSGVIENFP
jgi:hypothetical protein